MKIVFLDAKTVGDLPELNEFKKLGKLLVYQTTEDKETIKRIKGATVVITNKVRITKKIMNASPDLKFICVAATGMNNIDLEEASRRGIQVRNVKGYSTESVAQHTFSMLFYIFNHLPFYNKYVQSGKYSRSGMFTFLGKTIYELNGKEFGVIGMGTIGKRVAEIAAVFGAKVSYYSTSGKNDLSLYPKKSLEELLKESDVISIHAPLNDSTRDLIGMKELKQMKKNAVLVNTGRGGIIVEKDLVKALNQNIIFSAAVDVYEKEPLPLSHPFLKVMDKERLLLTPHIAWASLEARRELLRGVYKNIERFKEEM